MLDEHTVAYLDVVGSGAETIAHLRENGRIVVMLCAFEGPPRIVRLHGSGRVLEPGRRRVRGAARLGGLRRAGRGREPAGDHRRRRRAGRRLLRLRRAAHAGRGPSATHLDKWAAKKLRVGGPDALEDYKREHNTASLDGLPAVTPKR